MTLLLVPLMVEQLQDVSVEGVFTCYLVCMCLNTPLVSVASKGEQLMLTLECPICLSHNIILVTV